MAVRNFNLFGEELPENWGKPGRPIHVPTADNASKIRLLLIARWTVDAIAKELGLSAPTLRKHYFSSGKVNLKQAKQLAIAEVRGKTLMRLDKASDDGNVAAMKALLKIVEAEAISELPKAMEKGVSQTFPEGKKKALDKAARKAKGGWADRGLPGITH